jgi:hypothetical protein
VSGGVPILREHNVLEPWRDVEDRVDDGIAISDSQRAAGTKVVLYVDDYQDVMRGDLHWIASDGSCA